ncbi:thermonuclease family protein [Candidatus Collierbacteria bacterium]|nr:thermonuclease family protein [Candidatus Collierbacteria bacterium]
MPKFPSRLFPLILLFLLFPSLILNAFLLQRTNKAEEGIKVLGVIDGDTLVLDGKVRLRLRSVDAPELDFCGGPEAKQELERLVSEKKVAVKEQIIDQRGRPMGLVYADGKSVNEQILTSGWGRFHSDITDEKENLKAAYEKAKEQKLGIWGPKCQQTENTDNPKCNIKGNIDKNSDRRNYYFPGCAQYNFTIVEKDMGEGWFCSEKEAQKAGYTRSKTCFTPYVP